MIQRNSNRLQKHSPMREAVSGNGPARYRCSSSAANTTTSASCSYRPQRLGAELICHASSAANSNPPPLSESLVYLFYLPFSSAFAYSSSLRRRKGLSFNLLESLVCWCRGRPNSPPPPPFESLRQREAEMTTTTLESSLLSSWNRLAVPVCCIMLSPYTAFPFAGWVSGL